MGHFARIRSKVKVNVKFFRLFFFLLLYNSTPLGSRASYPVNQEFSIHREGIPLKNFLNDIDSLFRVPYYPGMVEKSFSCCCSEAVFSAGLKPIESYSSLLKFACVADNNGEYMSYWQLLVFCEKYGCHIA